MGYNKLAGGTVNPPVQKPAAYRLCAQAPDFGALFGVRHVTRQEEADVLMYTYTTPGRPQQVGDAYSDALSAYGYTYSGNFTDSDGRPVNVYANGSVSYTHLDVYKRQALPDGGDHTGLPHGIC